MDLNEVPDHMRKMRPVLFAVACLAIATPAWAQYAPGSIGNGGRMPETMSPPPTISPPSTPSPPATSLGSRYPNTESLSRERAEYRGYQVDRITRQNNGSWKADGSRDPVPTRPKGTPSEVIIYPDGRMIERY